MAYLEVDGAKILIDASSPEQWVDSSFNREGLSAPVMCKEPLLPVARAPDRITLLRSERHHVRCPVREVQMLQTWRIAAHFDGIGVTLGT